MVQLNPVPVFGAKKIPVPFDENVSLKFPYHHISGFALSLALKQRLDWGNSEKAYSKGKFISYDKGGGGMKILRGGSENF